MATSCQRLRRVEFSCVFSTIFNFFQHSEQMTRVTRFGSREKGPEKGLVFHDWGTKIVQRKCAALRSSSLARLTPVVSAERSRPRDLSEREFQKSLKASKPCPIADRRTSENWKTYSPQPKIPAPDNHLLQDASTTMSFALMMM